MIPFPFSLFYILSATSGFEPFTGLYESYERYSTGFLSIFKSGVMLESGKSKYTTGRYGFFTGYSFDSNFYFQDNYELYSTGNIFEYRSGIINNYNIFLNVTGKSFFHDIYFNDNYELYSTGFDSQFIFTGYYSGQSYQGKISTGHSIGGYIRPTLQTTVLSVPNLTSIGPAYFTGSGLILTGDWDRTNNVKIGYLNKASGLFFFDHLLRWDRPAGSIDNFTIEIALRRSGWKSNWSQMVDFSLYSGFGLLRWFNTDTLGGVVDGEFDQSTYTLPNDRWTYVSYVRSGTEGRFYFSGILSNIVVTNANSLTDYFPIYLGRNATDEPDDLQFWGYMDEFRFWNYPRTSGQIYSGSTGTVDPSSAGLQCYLSL